MGTVKELETITKDFYDLLGSLKNAKDSNYDPRTGIDVMTDLMRVGTNGIPNSKVKDLMIKVHARGG